ncbi:hypothetical protein L249_5888 [Ophiocordyceps polyrhachis-furcata BCC 54312]|uniref:Acid phosphatase n=1 Tax=Ophiocordyceps polyrhachis-furcata BCC 54312 TaxID=1330021 RepID=A0A367L0E6_9HYPO|nr:hypothetical protein L249_5888 [Ophiocordyceps polyrhachis-furcata BCC 54312]
MLAGLVVATAVTAVAASSSDNPCRAGMGTDGWQTSYTATATEDVFRAAATAKTTSPTSKVAGKAFDRIAIIWFENQNYEKAVGDANFNFFANKGISLSNYYAVTHPSQPNYMASIAGDYFGMDNDKFSMAPANISTVIDLLESKDISWGLYQEDMPFSGYEGRHFVNLDNGANDYVRRHNPAVLHNSIASSEQRLSQIKNLSMTDPERSLFHRDLEANALPQWMFITPNMTSDGHDSSVTVAGEWCRRFLEPLMSDERFMNRTLVLISWDETETYATRNQVLAILVGDSVPKELVGSEDESFYSHYSAIATVSANWDLPTLGRWDVGANVFGFVAKVTGDEVRPWSSETPLEDWAWNSSYDGLFNREGGNHVVPSPNLENHSRRPILPCIHGVWKDSGAPTYYTDDIHPFDGRRPPPGYTPEE